MADWTSLPDELLGLIAEHIFHIEDFIIFGLVCKSWQAAIVSLEKPPSAPRYPCLMLADDKYTKDGDDKDIKDTRRFSLFNLHVKDTQPRCFYSLFSGEVYKSYFPEAAGRLCMGTGFGWLLTLGIDLEINLFHPFSKHQIKLPPQPTFTCQYDDELEPEELFDMFVQKAVLSSPPLRSRSPNDKGIQDPVVMTIYGEFGLLAFARLGDKRWTDVKVPSRIYDDVVYYKGRFYAVDCHGIIVVCDIDDDSDPRATVIASPPPKSKDSEHKYLVESSGDLLLVSRIPGGLLYSNDSEGDDDEQEECINDERPKYCTTDFVVWKMKACAMEGGEHPYCWVEINTLGDRALFLGNNSSVSLSPSNYNGCFKANCIYFTDDNREMFPESGGGSDLGFYNMEDKTIGCHYSGRSHSFYAPPLWYI